MTATTAFFHFAKKIHNRRRIPENPRIVAVGDGHDRRETGGGIRYNYKQQQQPINNHHQEEYYRKKNNKK